MKPPSKSPSDQASEPTTEETPHHGRSEVFSQAFPEDDPNLRRIIQDHPDGIVVTDLHGIVLFANPSACTLLSLELSAICGTDFGSQFPHGELIELEMARANGPPIALEVRSTSTVWGNQPARLLLLQDVSRQKAALLHDALHDSLTGLPSREVFAEYLRRSIALGTRRRDYRFAVLMMDLDRFNVLNDSLGHVIGDRFLNVLAEKLHTCLRPGDQVARFGGDEFVILIDDIKDDAEAMLVAERVHQMLEKPIDVNGMDVFSSASMGIALFGIAYTRPEELLRDAELAMYRAKELGGACHEVFHRKLHADAVKLLELETDLRPAVRRNEFRVYYQPIVALDTGKTIGFEALVRWQHPLRGVVSPSEFIPLAEQTGLIIPMGRWMLLEACRQLRVWQNHMPSDPPLSMSVNLSQRQFTQTDLVEQIAQIMQETGIEPLSLKLEITESMLMNRSDVVVDTIMRLRELGTEVLIDDFGTGYSSLSYLQNFPVTSLKIDRSFISRLGATAEGSEMVRTIVALARNLGMDVIAEGVETAEQHDALRALQCKGQGFLFSHPMDTETAGAFLRNDRGSAGSNIPGPS